MTTAATSQGQNSSGDRGHSFALFLLLGWIVCVAGPLGDRGHPDLWGLLAIFLLLWQGCRLVPWRGLTLRRHLKGWAWACLTGALGSAGTAGWLALGASDPERLFLALWLGILAALLVCASLVLAAALRWVRGRVERDWSGAPAWLPASRSLSFLALSAPVLNPGWLGLDRHPYPLGREAVPGLLVLMLAVLWRRFGRPALSARLLEHPAWLGQAVVAGCGLAWALDLTWLVHVHRLPALVLEPMVFWPGVLPLLAGAELLVLTLLWHRRPLPDAQPRPLGPLPLWCCAAALLLALAAHRPGLALAAGLLAGWLELFRPAARSTR
ncbi:MAG: hypothetical protein WC326_08680 [Candidatus Delongbacteria bacterium]